MFGLTPWKKHGRGIGLQQPVPHKSNGDLATLSQFRNEFEDLWNRYFEEDWLNDRFFGKLPVRWDESFSSISDWDVGWEDRGQEYLLQAELPGFEPEDFDLQISGKMLTLRAEHNDEKQEKER